MEGVLLMLTDVGLLPTAFYDFLDEHGIRITGCWVLGASHERERESERESESENKSDQSYSDNEMCLDRIDR
jgi:hypothetical protein